MMGGGLDDVERAANTVCLTNDTLYRELQNDLSDAVCEKYPALNSGTIPKIVWKPEYTPSEFLEQAKEQ